MKHTHQPIEERVQRINNQLINNRLTQRVDDINKTLRDEELHLYVSGSEYYVIALMNLHTREIRATFGLNIESQRDMCLTKGFLDMIENARASEEQAVA